MWRHIENLSKSKIKVSTCDKYNTRYLHRKLHYIVPLNNTTSADFFEIVPLTLMIIITELLQSQIFTFSLHCHTCDIFLFRRALPIFCPFMRKSPYEKFQNFHIYILYISLQKLKHSLKTFLSLFVFMYACLHLPYNAFLLTLCLPVSSADNFGKQFGTRSGPTNRRA